MRTGDGAVAVWSIAHGAVRIDHASGAPVGFVHDKRPDARWLLDPARDRWHTSEYSWGSGFVVSSVGSARWNAPDTCSVHARGSRAEHALGQGLSLVVERAADDALHERYTLLNATGQEVVVTGLGIVLPIRDVYDDAATALAEAVHAHVWAAGSTGWVLVAPMAGDGPVLVVELVEGELGAYSIDSRNQYTSSNARGHIVLQPTDLAGNPDAFGGQREIRIPDGGSYTVAFRTRFHDTREAATEALAPAWSLEAYCAEVGSTIALSGVSAAEVRPAAGLEVLPGDGNVRLASARHGAVGVDIAGTRTELLFHAPVRDLVVARTRFILARQRSAQRTGDEARAFVPFDTRTGLTQLTGGWPDWSNGAERAAMPTLIQQARLRGWVGSEVDAPLQGWADFARTRLLDSACTPLGASDTWVTKPRLYNAPWLAHFFSDQFTVYGAPEDRDLAARILERSYQLGAERHLSIGQPEAVVQVAAQLDAAGEPDRAATLRQRLVGSALHFAELGRELPAHEVKYEQSMVAPLVSLYAIALRLDPELPLEGPLRESVRWLRAFGGPQPHARLNSVGIRHWDGYWFGALRLWGDVFPHHWSVLSAVALEQLPEGMKDERMRREAEQIFRANLVNFAPDGTATCAFVYPSTVDGIPGHVADPLINDQDWALTLLLRSGHALAGDPPRA